MNQDVLIAILVTALAGAIGGFLARVVPNGVGKKPLKDAPAEAGAVVSTLAGAAVAVAAFLATEPISAVAVFATAPPVEPTTVWMFTWGDVVNAFVAGLAGIKLLLTYQDSKTLRTALGVAAARPPSPDLAAAVTATPREVLATARGTSHN
ncbi:hypothetical protein H5399_08070 [Tessaracoccus sp. MC1627]|uniref:hypothetical protein n=1 Tax=Tessaracoccus sp. MC1627 TaxID=2760312 RepID=UPI0015FF6F7F|nr:hypothetical protein [Tessaracoccus sp. MC1627]MBB1512557.1 hypothetical protein [Tessaracoccus sp. MC1627]